MKFNALYGVILVAAIFSGPTRAVADPVTLICVDARGESSWILTVDATAGTTAGSGETNQATFTDQNIAWHDTLNGQDYNLNRVSGVLVIGGSADYTCHPGHKQF